MRTRDTRTGYGWISIALHWLTAIVILTLWFIGSSIQADLATGSTSTLRLHTSIAITAYLLLWARVIWRFKFGHPDAMPEQRGLFYQVGKYTHLLILAAVAGMLCSGPLMVWSRGEPIYVFSMINAPSGGLTDSTLTLTRPEAQSRRARLADITKALASKLEATTDGKGKQPK